MNNSYTPTCTTDDPFSTVIGYPYTYIQGTLVKPLPDTYLFGWSQGQAWIDGWIRTYTTQPTRYVIPDSLQFTPVNLYSL